MTHASIESGWYGPRILFDDNLATHTSITRIQFEITSCHSSTHKATESHDFTSSRLDPALPDPEIQLQIKPTHIGHGAIEQPLTHHLRQDADLALARLESRMIRYINTQHEDLAVRINSMTTSCANIEKKIIKRDHTTADTNQNTKTADGARGNLGNALKGFHESIGRLSAAADALGSRSGVRENMVGEDDVYERDKDDCVERFA